MLFSIFSGSIGKSTLAALGFLFSAHINAALVALDFNPPSENTYRVGLIEVSDFSTATVVGWDLFVPANNGFNLIPFHYTPQTSVVVTNLTSSIDTPSVSFEADIPTELYLNIFFVDWSDLSQGQPQNALMWIRDEPDATKYDKRVTLSLVSEPNSLFIPILILGIATTYRRKLLGCVNAFVDQYHV